MKKISSFLCSVIITFSFPAWCEEGNDKNTEAQDVQESKYVTDKLRLSLYKKPSANSGTLKLLSSGDILDVLDRSGPYSKVRTSAGITGWVKNGFLVSTPTSSYLLVEEQEKNKKLSEQLDKYANTQQIVADYENTISMINQDKESTLLELNTLKQEHEQISELNTDLQAQLDANLQETVHMSWKEWLIIIQKNWYILLSSVFVLFLTGFLFGKKMVETQVRKRFQGVKVL